MRRSYLAMLLLTAAITTIATGCRQTTGNPAAGPLNPLSPNNPGTGPALLPFGGSTRVTPPSTGSYGVPNNYLGGPAPIGQSNNARNSASGFAAAPRSAPIGSGVSPAGWTETNSNFAPANGLGNGSANGLGNGNALSPLNANDPRRGGMQVIDLTGTPPPPGYRTQPSPQNFNSTQNFNAQPSLNAQQRFNAQQRSNLTQNFGRSIQAPAARDIANAIAPGPSTVIGQTREFPQNSSIGNLTPVSPGAIQPGRPSTDPINISRNPQNSLPWRRPGTQF